ncbi:MAG: hypothetical protein LBN11_03095 [Tannerella sp.]|jgi:hypothetical protein|nr:hypothetical protein [Tannerella sp.]
MKKTFLKFALMSIVAATCVFIACDNGNDDENKENEAQIATQAQTDAFAFLLCANNAFTAYPDETSAEYQQAVGACLASNLTIASLSFGKDEKPNNTYTKELYAAITETVTTMYVGQTPAVIATSIAGIQYMIYNFYLSLQGK